MSIGIAVIGAGMMGADHALRLEAEIKGAHLAMVSDIDENRARDVIARAGARDVRYASGPLAAIDDETVDAVIVAAPDGFHVPLTLAALRAGKPVLCEKPLAPAADECLEVLELEQRLVAAGERARVTLGFMRRFDPGCQELRETVVSGELGPALMTHCVHRNVDAYPGGSEHTITASAVHEFDFIPWLLGSPIRSVTWHAARSSSRTPRQDPQLVLIETADGVLSTLELFMSAKYGYEVRCELVCEEGTRSLRNGAHVVTRADRRGAIAFPADSTRMYADAYRRELQAWIASIVAGDDPARHGLANAWDGYEAAAVAEAVLQSMAQGGEVRLSLPERPAFYR